MTGLRTQDNRFKQADNSLERMSLGSGFKQNQLMASGGTSSTNAGMMMMTKGS